MDNVYEQKAKNHTWIVSTSMCFCNTESSTKFGLHMHKKQKKP